MSLVKRQRVDNVNGTLTKTSNGSDTLSDGVVLESNTGSSILSGTFSHDGSLIATGGTDNLVNIWTFPDNENLSLNTLTISGHKSAVTSLKWSRDDSLVFSSSADKTLGIWDLETGQRIRKLKGHELAVNEVCEFQESNSQLLVSCSDDGYLLLWDSREKTFVKEFKTDYPLMTCTLNNSANTVFTSGVDPTIYALDLKKIDSPLWTLESHKDYVTSLSISEDDLLLVSRSNDGTLRSYNSKSFVAKNVLRARPGVYDGSISNYDNLIRCKNFGNYLISGSDDKHLTLWDLNSRKLLKKLGGHIGSVLDVDFNANVNCMLSTSSDGTCIIRRLQ